MPVREINLISVHRPETSQELFARKLTTFWTPLVLGFYVLIFASVFGYALWLSSQLLTQESIISATTAEIAQKQKDEGLYLFLKQRGVALVQIIKSSYPFYDVFAFFQTYNKDGVTIRSVKMADDATVLLEVSLVDSFSLDSFVKELLAVATDHFSRVELVDLSYKEGTYTLALDIGYLKK